MAEPPLHPAVALEAEGAHQSLKAERRGSCRFYQRQQHWAGPRQRARGCIHILI